MSREPMRLFFLLPFLCVALRLAAPCRADEDDPDTEIAKRHFSKGAEFYDQRDYQHAVDEFKAALRVRDVPKIHFNVARCYDRLERFEEAVEEYVIFVEREPADPDAPDVRVRIAVLSDRLERERRAKKETPPVPVAPSPAVAPVVVAPAVVAPVVVAPPVVAPAVVAPAVAAPAVAALPAPALPAPAVSAALPLAAPVVPLAALTATPGSRDEEIRRPGRAGLAVGLTFAALAVAGGAVALYFVLRPAPPLPLTMSNFGPIEGTP